MTEKERDIIQQMYEDRIPVSIKTVPAYVDPAIWCDPPVICEDKDVNSKKE